MNSINVFNSGAAGHSFATSGMSVSAPYNVDISQDERIGCVSPEWFPGPTTSVTCP
jgi:hypothetical protein